MSLRIEETFQVRAPVQRVWGYLTDPRQVVTCLPGAELTAVRDEATFLGLDRPRRRGVSSSGRPHPIAPGSPPPVTSATSAASCT